MPLIYKFSPGDEVIYTNDFGVCLGVKTIISREDCGWRREGYSIRPGYNYEGSDTPWCPVCETNLQLADEEDLMMQDWWIGADEYFQTKYGFNTPKELLDAVLDGDPWEGEN